MPAQWFERVGPVRVAGWPTSELPIETGPSSPHPRIMSEPHDESGCRIPTPESMGKEVEDAYRDREWTDKTPGCGRIWECEDDSIEWEFTGKRNSRHSPMES